MILRIGCYSFQVRLHSTSESPFGVAFFICIMFCVDTQHIFKIRLNCVRFACVKRALKRCKALIYKGFNACKIRLKIVYTMIKTWWFDKPIQAIGWLFCNFSPYFARNPQIWGYKQPLTSVLGFLRFTCLLKTKIRQLKSKIRQLKYLASVVV